MIGNWSDLIVFAALVLLALSPFIIYGTYLLRRRNDRHGSSARKKVLDKSHTRSEPTLGVGLAGSSNENLGTAFDQEPAVGPIQEAQHNQDDEQSDGLDVYQWSAAGNNTGAARDNYEDSYSEEESRLAPGTGNETSQEDVEAGQEAPGRTEEPEAGERQEDEHAGSQTDSLGLPSGKAPPVPDSATSAKVNEVGGFPAIDENLLQPYFYYVVHLTVKSGMGAADIHQLSSELVTKTSVRMYQTLLCYDRDKGKWETPRPEKSYGELIWAVPMCNRSSKLTSQDISGIVKVVQNMMRRVGGMAEFPSHNDIDERRAAVDEFCEYVDHRVSANLIALSSSGGSLQRCGDIIDLALTGGMEMIEDELRKVVDGETWFTLKDGMSKDLSRISPDRRVASLVASLDFPHVSNPLKAFDEMFELTGMLSRVLALSFVDDEKKPIDQNNIDEVREHLENLIEYMLSHNVQPGSKIARALFS